jgi:hypothetical protein
MGVGPHIKAVPGCEFRGADVVEKYKGSHAAAFGEGQDTAYFKTAQIAAARRDDPIDSGHKTPPNKVTARIISHAFEPAKDEGIRRIRV